MADESRPDTLQELRRRGEQKLQFRAGFFNVFNTASATTEFGNDIDFALETTCNRRVDHVPNGIGDYADDVCDPTGGYAFTQNNDRQFREDQHQARAPDRGAGGEVLLPGLTANDRWLKGVRARFLSTCL